MRLKTGLMLVLLSVELLFGVNSLSQNSETHAQNPNPGYQGPLSDQDPAERQRREKFEKDMAKRANEERQAQLRRDTDRLLQLSTELKQYVDKTNQNVLSVDVVKKAEEIEKLAHSVKEKMKGN